MEPHINGNNPSFEEDFYNVLQGNIMYLFKSQQSTDAWVGEQVRKYGGHEVLVIVFKHTMSFYEKDTSQAFYKSPSV